MARRIRPPKHAPKGFEEGGQFIGRGFVGKLLVKLFKADAGKRKPQPMAPALSPSRAVKRMTTVAPRHEQQRGTSALFARAERTRGLAQTLSELDELRANEATPRVMEHRLGGRGKLHDLPDADVAELVAAARSGDRDHIAAAISAVEARHGLTRITGPAGDVERFDRRRHEPIGPSIPDGAPVHIVRPGYEADVDGRIPVHRAVVEEATPGEAATVAPVVRERRPGRPESLIPPARPRQPRTHKVKRAPKRTMVPSDSPAVVKVSRARAVVKPRNLPKPGPTPRTNARVADSRPVAGYRLGVVTQLHTDSGYLVVRWDDGRSERLPITTFWPGWQRGSGSRSRSGPATTKVQMAARLRAAVADRNSDEVTILLSRMSPDDIAELGKRLNLPRSQRTNRVLILQALLAAQ